MTLFLLPIANSGPISVTSSNYLLIDEGAQLSGAQDEATWWNSTFIYRRYFNFTEPDVSDRSNVPVHLYLTFDDEHCYRDSIRVMHYNEPGWSAQEFQVWNITYYPGSTYVKSARVSFMVDVDKNTVEDNVYIYYAKQDVGSVSYPNFFPFIYKSYTFSLINLVSYYDNNQYNLEMYDDPLFSGDGTWKDPNTVANGVDTRWKNLQVSPHSTPNGVLNTYDNVRYEPTSSDYNDFFGYYTVYSNYPLAVSMGLGDKGSNPAINDWFPGVNELGDGIGQKFILGGVEGFESRNEGKYWVQAHQDNTEVYVWDVGESPDTGWSFYNGTAVSSWPAVIQAGEYIAKRDVVYTTYMIVNSTKPVSIRAGDSDATYSRDIGGFFPDMNGALVGEEFYTIDMGNGNDDTRVTNIGDSPVTVEWWRNTGSGWVKGTNLTNIPVNSSANIPPGTASSSNPEDILHIKAAAGSKIFVEGIYNAPSVTDHGDWNPTMTGDRFGLDYRIWGGRGQKIFIYAMENAKIDISSYSGTAQLELAAGAAGFFMPVSSTQSLHDLHSNATISIVVCGRFSTSNPYYPSGDQGYGWMVPSYAPENDQAGISIDASDEVKLYEFDITIVDMDNVPVAGASVELLNTNDSVWIDDNGLGRSGMTDANGLIVFEGLSNQTFRIATEIDAAAWLSTSYSNIWIQDTTDQTVDGSVTHIEIELKMASIDIYLEDLMDNAMIDNDNEDTNLRLNNQTGNYENYTAQGQTNTSGWVHFFRIPQDDYDVFARYAGSLGWSYTYDNIADFSTWTIDATDFDGGSFTRDWDLPLITLDIHVTSWDQLDVIGATIKINNSVDMNQYSITKTSDVNGDYSFYRIVNGTWNLGVWKADDYVNTPFARNFTVSLPTLQGSTSKTVQLPLSRLVVRVQTGLTTYVEGAQVNVTMRGVGLVAQGTTNSTGHVTFLNIHANLTSPYTVGYNLTVTSGQSQNGTFIELLAKCDYDFWYINKVFISPPTYLPGYTELNATTYFTSVRWGQNASLTVGWFGRTGGGDAFTITYDGTSWLNYTIYFDGSPVGWGTWNISDSEWIVGLGGINFLVTIDTNFWPLDVSESAYQVVFNAYTNEMLTPAPIIVYVTVLPAQTSQGVGTADINEAFGTNGAHLYWLYDTTNSDYVSGLNVYTFSLREGTSELNFGPLVNEGNGTYSLPMTALSGVDVGSYLIYITLEKLNYINQTITVGVTIYDLPMVTVITSAPDYEWSLNSGSIVFQYTINWNLTTTDLTGVSVNIEWLTYPGGVSFLNLSRVLDASSGNLTYLFTHDVVSVGNWTVRITCIFDNYGMGIGTFEPIEVTEALTTIVVTPVTVQPVNWTQLATFFVDYKRGVTGLENAYVATNWSSTVIIEYVGNGRYSVSFDTTIPADSYTVTIIMSLANHQTQTDTAGITINVPVSIETEFGSEETPLVAYWTRTFDVVVRLMDTSRENTSIIGATIDFDWFYYDNMGSPISVYNGVLDVLSPGFYNVTLLGSQANPLFDKYQIILTVSFGPSAAVTTIFLIIQNVPNEITLETGGFVPFYGDNMTVWFYWNNTFDNEPIILPSSTSFVVEPIGVPISGLTNYGNGSYSFVVDTKNLGMNVDDYSGFYRIRISMLADGFDYVEDVFAFFLMRESPTEMQLVESADTVWSELMTVKVDLRDSLHDVLVWTGATVEIAYGTFVIPMTSFGNGTFWAEFDSASYFAAINPADDPYEVTVRYSIPNYVDGEIIIDVRVNPILCEINIVTAELIDGIYEDGLWTDTVEVQYWVFFAGESTHPAEGIGSYYWVGYESVGGIFSYAGFIYTLTINTTEVPAGTQTLRLLMTLQNHTVTPYDLTIELNPLVAGLDPDQTSLSVVYASISGISLSFDLSYGGSPLSGATLSFVLGGTTYQHTTESSGTYVFAIPTLVSGLDAPMTYVLNFSMVLQNYTIDETTVDLTLLAPTTLTFDSEIAIEYGETITVYFTYWDTHNLRSVPLATVTAELPDGTDLLVEEYNTTHYVVVITAADVGEIATTPYLIQFTATASGYQSYTGSSTFSLDVYVSEPTYDLGPLGRPPRTTVNAMLFMTLVFGIIAGSVVGVRRMRIPYQIKQIDKALNQIEKGKTAKVEKIKTMGMVVSELLASGLAELDIGAPVIETGPVDDIHVIIDDEAEELLGELDALDDLGLEEEPVSEETDFEAELEAELEAIDTEVDEPEVDVEPEVTEDSVEEAPEEIEKHEPEVEIEPEVVEDTEPETPEVEPEEEGETDVELEETDLAPMDEEVEADSTKRLSKQEMIDLLPSEILEKYSEEDLRKFSKKELQELLDITEET